MRITPSNSWTLTEKAPSKLLQWKVYIRSVATLTESLTGVTPFTEITEYVKDIPSISQGIEYETGQFSSDSFSLNLNNIKYWMINWLNFTTELEVKITLNIGLSSSSLTTDTPIIASGFIDKMSWSFNEETDAVSVEVQSYDEYANRITGKNLTFQTTKANINGSGLTTLICNNISGVYIYEATPSAITQTLDYEYDVSTSISTIKYNNGEFVTIGASSGLVTLIDEDRRLCKIYVQRYELEEHNCQQKFVYRTALDSLPYLFYDDATISELLTAITNEFPITSATITAPTFSSYDNGYRLNARENIINSIGNGTAKCIEYDTINNVYWVGVGNKLYQLNSAGAWTLKATAAEGYIIKKIFFYEEALNFDTRIILVLLPYYNGNYYKIGVYLYDAASYSEYFTSKNPTLNSKNGYVSFSISTTDELIFYSIGLLVKYMDLTDGVETTFGGSATRYFEDEYFGFYSKIYDAYYGITNVGASYYILKITSSAEALMSTGFSTPFINGVGVDGSNIKIYYTDTTTDNPYKYTLTGGGTSSSNTLLSSTLTCFSFYKYGSYVYFYGNGSLSGSTYFPFGYITIATDAFTTISNTNILLGNTDYKVKNGALIYNGTLFYLITPNGRFMQFATSNTNRIEKTWDTSTMSVRDALNELCRTFNLVYVVKPNKTMVVFPRSSSSGVIQTGSINNLDFDVSNIVSVSKKFGFGKATKVRVTSNNISADYNGTSYNTFDADGEKIVEITSDLIQPSSGYTLRDIATHCYSLYSRSLNVLTFYVPTPSFQYEVTDGAIVDLSGTILNYYGSQNNVWSSMTDRWGLTLAHYETDDDKGIIQKQNINLDGTMEIEVLI